MVGGPSELPEGGEGGGGGFVFPGRGPNPAELPVDFVGRGRASAALLGEIVRLRNRLHFFENQQLVAAILGRRASVIGGPNELPVPEMGEGGGGGGIPPIFPGENPAELPISDDVARSQIGQLVSRFGAFENRVVQLLGNLEKQMADLKKAGPR